jgi:hypothetical protein
MERNRNAVVVGDVGRDGGCCLGFVVVLLLFACEMTSPLYSPIPPPPPPLSLSISCNIERLRTTVPSSPPSARP